MTLTSTVNLVGFPEKMAIIDCETTGGKATRDRITELAIILVDDGSISEVWQQLINPQTTIPPWITKITSITQSMVHEQPSFNDLWPQIKAKLEGRVLVAHNARFDYGFLKNEVKRCGETLTLKTLCSVKFSRLLYPQHKKHSLDAIIQRLGIQVSQRHRALDDAEVIVKLFQQACLDYDEQMVQASCQRLLKRPSLPSHLKEEQIQTLPDSPGVYYFYNQNHRLLYVGKSVNIKSRVLSHFYQDHQNSTDHHLSHQLHSIEFEETPTDFGAQILEAQRVKQRAPTLNKRLKKVQALYELQAFENHGYLEIKVVKIPVQSPKRPAENAPYQAGFGLFRSKRQATKRLEKLVEKYFLCQRLSHLESSHRGSCFAYQLKKCLGACCGKEPAESYNLRVKHAMLELKRQQWPYSGPILVEEVNPAKQSRAWHLIQDWQYLGQVQSADELWSWEPILFTLEGQNKPLENQWFDLDIYFILIRFLLSDDLCQKTGLRIHVLNPQQLANSSEQSLSPMSLFSESAAATLQHNLEVLDKHNLEDSDENISELMDEHMDEKAANTPAFFFNQDDNQWPNS